MQMTSQISDFSKQIISKVNRLRSLFVDNFKSVQSDAAQTPSSHGQLPTTNYYSTSFTLASLQPIIFVDNFKSVQPKTAQTPDSSGQLTNYNPLLFNITYLLLGELMKNPPLRSSSRLRPMHIILASLGNA